MRYRRGHPSTPRSVGGAILRLHCSVSLLRELSPCAVQAFSVGRCVRDSGCELCGRDGLELEKGSALVCLLLNIHPFVLHCRHCRLRFCLTC